MWANVNPATSVHLFLHTTGAKQAPSCVFVLMLARVPDSDEQNEREEENVGVDGIRYRQKRGARPRSESGNWLVGMKQRPPKRGHRSERFTGETGAPRPEGLRRPLQAPVWSLSSQGQARAWLIRLGVVPGRPPIISFWWRRSVTQCNQTDMSQNGTSGATVKSPKGALSECEVDVAEVELRRWEIRATGAVRMEHVDCVVVERPLQCLVFCQIF